MTAFRNRDIKLLVPLTMSADTMAHAVAEIPRLIAELRAHIIRKTGKPIDPDVDFLTTQIEVLSAAVPTDIVLPELDLVRKEQQILNLLASRPGHVFSRDAVMSALYFAHPNDWPAPKIIDIFICRIRNQLRAADSPVWIETIWGLGWRLVHKRARDAKVLPNARRGG